MMVEQEDIIDYASRGGDCFITQIEKIGTGNGTDIHMNNTFTVHCDCSDPENYKFKDEGKF